MLHKNIPRRARASTTMAQNHGDKTEAHVLFRQRLGQFNGVRQIAASRDDDAGKPRQMLGILMQLLGGRRAVAHGLRTQAGLHQVEREHARFDRVIGDDDNRRILLSR